LRRVPSLLLSFPVLRFSMRRRFSTDKCDQRNAGGRQGRLSTLNCRHLSGPPVQSATNATIELRELEWRPASPASFKIDASSKRQKTGRDLRRINQAAND
jgi:hypothetical protein